MPTYLLKLFFVAVFLSFSCFGIFYMFYQEDVKNSLPTEVPKNYHPTTFGQSFGLKTTKKLKLIHFFNPDCPCSKFNSKHITYLAETFGNKVEFVAYSNSYLPKNYPIPVLIDKDGKMAKLLGVYSTPQAVLLDSEGKLLYRGNYNKSRYCGNKNSEYVVLAINQALHNQNSISSIMQKAGLPYGCSLQN